MQALQKKKFAVVLSGCGVYDGAEIIEATMTLLAIEKLGAGYDIFAPNITQYHVVNHLTGDEVNEKRNVLAESARIARGNITALDRFLSSDYDGIIFPGGFGAAKNLCTWAIDGDDCEVEIDAERSIKVMFQAKKPIGAMCISPVILGRLFKGALLTTGDDKASADFIEKMGAHYTKSSLREVVIDPQRKFFTTPCYMLDATVVDIAESAENLVREMLKAM
jgi:enhancing lycopene biosynthesis protein 2